MSNAIQSTYIFSIIVTAIAAVLIAARIFAFAAEIFLFPILDLVGKNSDAF